ncbi:hypothetical protein [uncultured Shewanella sp.]|uniref:hypothetical protein n=1 Tax=uncultured Shewanella sp. TaxID=173975 RepID=UPI00261A94BA|nr:hypothetical protein [uncultured Shewanella sp.]
MKRIFILVAIAGAYYFYNLNQSVEVNISSYQDLLKKVEASHVSKEELKKGSHLLVEFLCNDTTFQVTGGSTVKSCLDNFKIYKETCDDEIFGLGPDIFTKKEKVTATASSYLECVGIS